MTSMHHIKYEVFDFLRIKLLETPKDYYSVKQIAKGLKMRDSTFWNERHIRNAIIELVSEGMLDTSINKNWNDWRMLVRARWTKKEEVP